VGMKAGYWKFFLGAVLVAGLMCAACKRDRVQTTAVPTAAPVDVSGDVPSEEEIAAFVSTWQDPSDANTSIHFDVEFNVVRLSPYALEAFRQRGKIPFAISVNFYRYDPVEALQLVNTYSIFEGDAEIAVLDADGRLVVRQRQGFASLCPS